MSQPDDIGEDALAMLREVVRSDLLKGSVPHDKASKLLSLGLIQELISGYDITEKGRQALRAARRR